MITIGRVIRKFTLWRCDRHIKSNGKHWLEKFLPSVVSHLNPKRDVLRVADNASTDDLLNGLKPTILMLNFLK